MKTGFSLTPKSPGGNFGNAKQNSLFGKKAPFRGMWVFFKILAFIFLFVSTSLIGSAQDQLNNYLEQAAENNPGLNARFNEYMAALEVVPQMNSIPDPQVAFGYFIKPVETRVGPQRFKFSVTQMLPWFGTTGAKEDVATQAAKAKFEAFQEAKSKLYNDVRSNYFNLYFTGKGIQITRENIELLESIRKMANIKVEAGLVPAVDQYRIEMEMGDLENQLALLLDKYNAQEVMFRNLLNNDTLPSVNLPEQLWENEPSISKMAMLDSIRIQNHQLLALDMQAESYRLKQEVARLTGSPQIKLGLDYTIVQKGKNNLAGTDALMLPTVGLTIPLYRNKYKSMINEAVYEETAKKEERVNKQNVLETVFEQTWNDFSDAKRRIELNRRQAGLAEQSLKLLETAYTTDNKNFEEVLRMERRLLKYQLELQKALADKQAALSFIDYLMGK